MPSRTRSATTPTQAQRELCRARDEGRPLYECEEQEQLYLEARRVQQFWRHASDEYEDRAKRLWRFLDEKLPLMCASLQTADLAAEPEPPPRKPPARRRRPPSRPRRRKQHPLGLGCPYAPRPLPQAKPPKTLAPLPPPRRTDEALVRVGGAVGVSVSAVPPRRRVPSTTDDLRQAWRSPQPIWQEVSARWRGPGRRAFEEQFWQALDWEVQATIRQLEQLGEAADRVLRAIP